MRLCWQAMASCCWKIPEPEQADLSLIAVREKLVERRTETVNLVRGDGEGGGERVAASSPEGFAEKAKDEIPEVLREALAPMVEQPES